MKINKKIILKIKMINIILPSTINPSTNLKKIHHYPPLRMGELIHNITYIANCIFELNLRNNFRILVIDSSPKKDYFNEVFEIIKSLNDLNINIEYYYLNNHLTKKDYLKGQGWCECKSINHAYLKFPKQDFLKISSRYIYSNLDEILSQVINTQNTICTHNIFRKLTFCPILFFKYYVWEEFVLSKEFLEMQDSKKIYMEHALYSFLKIKKTQRFKKTPQLIETCRSGNTNIKYNSNFFGLVKNNLYQLITNRHSKFLRNNL